MSNPLFDTLFRPTTVSDVDASAAPVRERGTRTRGGNAMRRTRAALLAGATQSVAVEGTRLTMAGIAARSGVAKATLYNHFRTRDAVLAALVVHEVEQLASAHGDAPLREALAGAARAISAHPVRAGLARVEPETLALLARIDPEAPGWLLARAGVDTLLAPHGRGGAPLVLRWLASFLLSPADAQAIDADLDLLLNALPDTSTAAVPSTAAGQAAASGPSVASGPPAHSTVA